MVLRTETVCLYPLENSKLHHTDLYELVHDEENPIAVLRRGEKFKMDIQFNRDFDTYTDEVRIIFNYGPRPFSNKGTQGIVKVQPDIRKCMDDNQEEWFGNVLEMCDSIVSMEVYAPPTIPIGQWKIKVECCLKNNSKDKSGYEHTNIMYFLLNPWNCHDLVYMPDEKKLDEYVLEDVGKIWMGPVGSHRGREWIFGQFDACILPVVWYILEKSGLNHSLRGDPIGLSRTISKMVNANDDNGVVVGSWTPPYDNGVEPMAWTGSIDILEQYYEKKEPVKYGQCWVFAGVVTTICRAIGMPSRVVSNIVSAHDTNSTFSIDKFFDENNEVIIDRDRFGNDMTWTFHVWNDVYMARRDLPTGYGGWQAIDATPQERSDGFLQCGPASLEAIRKGQVGLIYDVDFLVSSVNADYMKWKVDKETGDILSRISCNQDYVGKFILTKKPHVYDYNGDKDREDITNQYKPKEFTEEERLTLWNAVSKGPKTAQQIYHLPDTENHDMDFLLKDIDRIYIGDDFQIVLKISNKSEEDRTIKYTLSAHSVYYNGVKAHDIIRQLEEICIAPHSTEEVVLSVPAEVYLRKLVEYSIMKIHAIATCVETNQTWANEDDFRVDHPNINIMVPDEIPVGEISTIVVEFLNPIFRPLTNCKFTVSGPSVTKNQIVRCGDVGPGEPVSAEIKVSPTRTGAKRLVATFTSNELSDITGSAKVIVF